MKDTPMSTSTHGSVRVIEKEGEVSWKTVAGISGAVISVLATAWLANVSGTVEDTGAQIRQHGERLAALEASSKAEADRSARMEMHIVRIEEKVDAVLQTLLQGKR